MSKKRVGQSAQQEEQAVRYAFTRCTVKEELLRDLTHKAIGENGETDAFVMILQLIRDSMPETPAQGYAEATSLLFYAQTYAFNNSPQHVRAFMDYRERMKAQVEHYLRE
jgi:hypothetical protein